MDIITELEKEPLSDKDLERMARGKAKIILYDDLRDIDTLDNDWDAYIILLQITGQNIGHWILLINHESHIEHFDPYGIGIDEELSITHEKPYLSNLFQKSKKDIITNHIRFQARKENMNTCGRWCISRLNFADMPLEKFHTFIDKVHSKHHDMAATLLTMLL